MENTPVQPQQSTALAPAEPAASPAAAPVSGGVVSDVTAPESNYIGNSNVMDRSNTGSASSADTDTVAVSGGDDSIQPAEEAVGRGAGSGAELITFSLGVLSVLLFPFIFYYVKNMWATIAISGILALAALFLSYRNHRRGAMGPSSIVGISSATGTLMLIFVYLEYYLLLRSLSSTYGF